MKLRSKVNCWCWVSDGSSRRVSLAVSGDRPLLSVISASTYVRCCSLEFETPASEKISRFNFRSDCTFIEQNKMPASLKCRESQCSSDKEIKYSKFSKCCSSADRTPCECFKIYYFFANSSTLTPPITYLAHWFFELFHNSTSKKIETIMKVK